MRQPTQHPTQLELAFILLAVAVTAAVEIIIFVLQQITVRCGPFCNGLWSEVFIKGLVR